MNLTKPFRQLFGTLGASDSTDVDSDVRTDYGRCMPEDEFQRMLILERKRAERFGMPFMLVIFNIGQLAKARPLLKHARVEELTTALMAATREIDVKGWYIRDFLLGVIFPNVGPRDRDIVIEKINRMLYLSMESEDAQKVETLCLFYPSSSDSGTHIRSQPDVRGERSQSAYGTVAA